MQCYVRSKNKYSDVTNIVTIFVLTLHNTVYFVCSSLVTMFDLMMA
jgi:hypothetical protein